MVLIGSFHFQYRQEYGVFDEEDVTDDLNRIEEEEISIDKHDQSEKKKAGNYGLVPPPPYYTKKSEPSPAASSDMNDVPNHFQNSSGFGYEKRKPKSVRRNRFNQKESKEIGDNEESHKAKPNSHPPPYRRSSLDTEGKYTRERDLSLPHDSMLSPRTTQGPTRAASFEPDGMKGLIHPKLPNYDDLALRIASLTGKQMM